MYRDRYRPVGWCAAVLFALVAAAVAAAQDRAPAVPPEPTPIRPELVEPRDGVPPPPPEPAAPQPAKPKKAPPNPYRDPFYKNDFSYLDDPNVVSNDPFDALKRIVLAPRTTLDIGGEYGARLHNEYNLRLNGRGNDFLLTRTRLYGDLHFDKWYRFYGEAIDSTSSYERLPPRLSEENRWDAINLFGDLRVYHDGDGGALWARAGRQELDYGNQRLIAAAPWANTRVTFDGVKLFWASKTWDVDAFWVRPVALAQHVRNDHNFDRADPSQQLTGVYATWHGVKDHTVDAYFLRFEDSDPVVRGEDGTRGGFDANTLGGRWKGRRGDWLWEFEGAYQFGRFARDQQSAGFYVVGVGYQFESVRTTPTLWMYYDWASGDADPTDRRRGTFNQILPQTHIFLGWSDILGRQNLRDLNFLLTASPHANVTLIAELHLFWLQRGRDALYNNGGVPVRFDPTGAAGTRVGQEINLTTLVRLNRHASLLVSYGHFFPGPFLTRTGGDRRADFLYTWVTFKF